MLKKNAFGKTLSFGVIRDKGDIPKYNKGNYRKLIANIKLDENSKEFH